METVDMIGFAHQLLKMRFYRNMRSLVSIAARVVIAAVLLFALLAAGMRLPEAAAGHTCAMACCVGKAPHEAGSCMHTSCDVVIEEPPVAEDERLCGADDSIQKSALQNHHENAAAGSADSTTQQQIRNHDEPKTSVSVFTKPCPADCMAGGLSYSSSKRQDKPASNGESGKPVQPSLSARLEFSFGIVRELDQSFTPDLPRGPPASS